MLIKRNKKGMSLVEIMGAIFVLSFAVLAVATIFPAGLQMNRKTKVRIQAIQMAEGIIEELRHLPYYDPNAAADLITLASDNTNVNPTTAGWASFTPPVYCNNGSSPDWTPQVVMNSNVYKPTSRIFFRNRAGKDMRTEPSTPDTLVDTLAPKLMLPSIQIVPLTTSVTTLMYPYTPMLNRCRIHKIIVTVNIEEFVAGSARYSAIQLITYRSDGLTMTPGY